MLRCGRNDHKKSYCKTTKVYCTHCKSQKHTSHCCIYIPEASSTSNGETSDTASTLGSSSSEQSQWENLLKFTRKQKKKKSKGKDEPQQTQMQQPQAQATAGDAPRAPTPAARNTQPQPPSQGQQQYFYPRPPPGGYMYPSHLHLSSPQKIAGSSCSKIWLWQLHYNRWPSSINNILRQVRTRQEHLRTSPANQHSPQP